MHGSLLILGVAGCQLTPEEEDRLHRIQPAGVVLFSRNIASPEQTRQLTDDIRKIFVEEPIIAIDQEGGRVSRTKDIAPICPSAVDLTAAGNLSWIADAAVLTADQLRLLGCNLNFAPVLDIDHFPSAQNALRERCWGNDPQRVIDHAGQWNRWLRKRHLTSCAKHFPSCGRAQTDPHYDLPISEVRREELLACDIIPYTALMPELDAIMTSHVRFPQIDKEHPASMSPTIIRGFLRQQLGFDHHLVITDDLDMAAIEKAYGRGPDVKQAILAGNDIALICHQMHTADQAVAALRELHDDVVEEALARLTRFRKKLNGPLVWSDAAWRKNGEDIAKLREKVPFTQTNETNSPVAQY
jgi:beta-N-acetylhexosaminidase